MTYNYLALDFDGTLLTSDHIIDEKTKAALIAAQEQGVKLILASGRPTYAMTKFAEELQTAHFGGYLLSFNGSYMFDLANNTRISADELQADDVLSLYNYSKNFEFSTLIYDDTTILTDKINHYAAIESEITGMKLAEISDFHRSSAKIIFVHTAEYIEAVEAQVKADLGQAFTVARSLPFFLEITPKGIDKGASLTKLFNLIQAQPEELIACGDGGNDLTMIQFAGLGVAMDNARAEVKQAADFITADNNSYGIAQVIEKFILKTPSR
ncbi:MAG: Cof-type HAD-IIB family hydrolase [Culicoidibacterales bacterium]